MSFDAFISYSHGADATLAPALQRALHKFTKPWYRRRALRVFRDQTSLAASPALWPAIEAALVQSRWFLYLASPQAAQSHWVGRELQWWLEHRGSGTMLILLTDGTLAWDTSACDFDWRVTDAVARSLAGRFGDEPLYVDLRFAKRSGEMSLRHSKFRAAVLDIAAPLHGRPKEDLDGEDVRVFRRNRIWAWSASASLVMLTVVAVAAMLFAFAQREEAVRQRDQAVARQLRSEAQRLGAIDSRWDLSMLLMIESMRRAPDATSFDALWRLSRRGALPLARCPLQAELDASAFSPDGRRIAAGAGGNAFVFDATSCQEQLRIAFDGAIHRLAFDDEGRQLVVAGGSAVRVFDAANGRELRRLDVAGVHSVHAFSPAGRLVAFAEPAQVRVVEVFSGAILGNVAHDFGEGRLFVGNGGRRIALGSAATALLIDLDTGQRMPVPVPGTAIEWIAFSDDDRRATIEAYDNKAGPTVFDLENGSQLPNLARGTLAPAYPVRGRIVDAAPAPMLQLGDLADGRNPFSVATRSRLQFHRWSTDGEFVMLGHGRGDAGIDIVRTASGRTVARRVRTDALGIGIPFKAVTLSPHGDRFAAGVLRDIVVFAAHDGRPLASFGFAGGAPRIVADGDARSIVAITAGDRITIATAGDAAAARTLPVCPGARRLGMDRSATRAVLLCRDGQAEVIELASGRTLLRRPHASASPPLISPDGRRVALAAGSGRVFEVDGGHELFDLKGYNFADAAFSEDGRSLAFAGGQGVRLVDTSGGGAERRFNDGELAESVAFSADSRLLAVGLRERRVDVYELATGRHVARLDHKQEETQVMRIRALRFDAGGRRLATISFDPTGNLSAAGDTLRIFDLDSQRETVRATLGETALTLDFAADGLGVEFATGWRRLSTERLPLTPHGLIDDACARVTRNLSPEEWERYFGAEERRETCAVRPAAAGIG